MYANVDSVAMNNNTPTLTRYEESIAPWNEPMDSDYDATDYEPNILDRYDER